jgi:hypothetical protein
MKLDNIQLTDIVQLPAIKKGNMVQAFPPEILKLDEHQLRNMAIVMGGELVFIKLRAVYTPLQDEETMCTHKDCWRPVDRTKETLKCDTHG